LVKSVNIHNGEVKVQIALATNDPNGQPNEGEISCWQDFDLKFYVFDLKD
jgi:hypothetical protein